MKPFVYKGENAREISFPLGGIGAGCVGLAGNGQLIDIEILGRPPKGSNAGLSHFAIKAEDDEKVLDARVCQGPFLGSRSGIYNMPHYRGFGFGVDRAAMMGMPHFEDSTFTGYFPMAELSLADKRFPGKVKMTAFNPFIPLKDLDSSLPAAFFRFEIENTTSKPLRYSICFSLNAALLSKEGGPHGYTETDLGRAVILKTTEEPEAGMCIATDCKNGSHQLYWYRGTWFDNLSSFWTDFSAYGPLKNRVYEEVKDGDDLASLCATVEIPAGETGEICFVWSWFVPFATNYWNPPKEEEDVFCHDHEHGEDCDCGCGHDHEHGEDCDCGCDHEHGEGCDCGCDHEHGEGCDCGCDHEHGEGCVCGHEHGEDCDCGCGHEHGEDCNCGHCRPLQLPRSQTPKNGWRHYYATVFTGALDVAAYCIKNFRDLEAETRAFAETLFDSSLPREVLDAVSANLSVLKSPTCLRLEDGSLYGFEGCHGDSGSCEGSCTHVWSYTYAAPFLFPALERSMRQNEYMFSCHDSGAMGFRLMLPLGREATKVRPCADGQFATVMRVYREFKISGNLNWLKSLWPMVKKTIEYAWSEENYDRWDWDKDGILEGRQHHTLDMELFGPNAWLSGIYLGALQAGARMAELVGDVQAAKEYMRVYESGRQKLNKELFNGEYYIQRINLKDKALLESYTVDGVSVIKGSAVEAYWNEERGEIKYQIGEGCSIDQLLGQWHADLIGLDPIFDEKQAECALRNLYRNNFMERAGDYVNPCRVYCLDEESGLRICSWPEGKQRPFIGAPYSEESMHGFEYAAASHMILHGMEQEGLRCVKAVRDRYDGRTRNPWNEFECGSNYARSMASFALLLAYSGFSFNLYEGRIGFKPLHPKNFSCFWSLDSGWGKVVYEEERVRILLKDGQLTLKAIDVAIEGKKPVALVVDGREQRFECRKDAVECEEAFTAQREVEILFK